mmetsp:Transcript_19126/g.38918  ORF Transcript_19126/g.38918 Transcript_19126/m.38918 type:complete len:242 (-) Transcript_19126:13-738(-)
MQRLEAEPHVEPARALLRHDLAAHVEEAGHAADAQARRERMPDGLRGQDRLLLRGADHVAGRVEHSSEHARRKPAAKVLEHLVVGRDDRLGLIREKLQAREVGRGPRGLAVLDAEVSDEQSSPPTMSQDVLDHGRSIVVVLVGLVELESNLGHLDGLDRKALWQGSNACSNGLRDSSSLGLGFAIHGFMGNGEEEELENTHVCCAKHLRHHTLRCKALEPMLGMELLQQLHGRSLLPGRSR